MPKSMPTRAAASTPRRTFRALGHAAASTIAASLGLVLGLVLGVVAFVLGLLFMFWLAGKGPELVDALWTLYRALSDDS